MPNFFLGVGLIVFFPYFFSILKPPLPFTWVLLFFLNIGLTQTCIAIAVPHPLTPHGNLTKAPRGRQGNAKRRVRNKVFECTT